MKRYEVKVLVLCEDDQLPSITVAYNALYIGAVGLNRVLGRGRVKVMSVKTLKNKKRSRSLAE